MSAKVWEWIALNAWLRSSFFSFIAYFGKKYTPVHTISNRSQIYTLISFVLHNVANFFTDASACSLNTSERCGSLPPRHALFLHSDTTARFHTHLRSNHSKKTRWWWCSCLAARDTHHTNSAKVLFWCFFFQTIIRSLRPEMTTRMSMSTPRGLMPVSVHRVFWTLWTAVRFWHPTLG